MNNARIAGRCRHWPAWCSRPGCWCSWAGECSPCRRCPRGTPRRRRGSWSGRGCATAPAAARPPSSSPVIKLQISRSVCKNSNFLPTLYTAESVKRLVMVNFRWDHHHIVDYKPDMKFVRPPAEKYQDNYFNIMHCGELIIKCLEVTQVKVGFH